MGSFRKSQRGCKATSRVRAVRSRVRPEPTGRHFSGAQTNTCLNSSGLPAVASLQNLNEKETAESFHGNTGHWLVFLPHPTTSLCELPDFWRLQAPDLKFIRLGPPCRFPRTHRSAAVRIANPLDTALRGSQSSPGDRERRPPKEHCACGGYPMPGG